MAKVTGIGGVFFKSRDPEALAARETVRGSIGWFMDPEGTRIELWEPRGPDAEPD